MNGRWTRDRKGPVLFLFLSLAGLFIIVAGSYLGNIYLHLLHEPGATSPVFGPVDGKQRGTDPLMTAGLPPVTVYYVQTGVYTSREGAVSAQVELENMGYAVTVAGEGPYRVVNGVFGNRAAAARLAAELEEKKINSYISTIVLNESTIEYARSQKTTMDAALPFLEEYSRYLEKAAFVGDYPFKRVKSKNFNASMKELGEAFSSLEKHYEQLDPQVKKIITVDFWDLSGAFQGVGDALPSHWEEGNFYSWHVSLASLVENYKQITKTLSSQVKEGWVKY